MLPAHEIAVAAEFLGDALGDRRGGEAPGLRYSYQPAARAASAVEAYLRNLRCLAAPGFAAYDNDLVFADRALDFRAMFKNWELPPGAVGAR